jgi:hypothetical protein
MQLRFISSELNASESPASFRPHQAFEEGWKVLTVSGVADDPSVGYHAISFHRYALLAREISQSGKRCHTRV